jgi:hypothetical protein
MYILYHAMQESDVGHYHELGAATSVGANLAFHCHARMVSHAVDSNICAR